MYMGFSHAISAQSYTQFEDKQDNPERVAELLLGAEQLKRSDPKRSSSLLKQLAPYHLTASQNALKIYLEAYYQAIAVDLEEGILLLSDFVVSRPPPDVKVKALASLISIYTFERRFSEARPHIEQMLNLRDSLNSPDQQALIAYSLSHFYYYLGDYASAVEYSLLPNREELNQSNQCDLGMINSLALLKLERLTEQALTNNQRSCEQVNDQINLSNLYVAELELLMQQNRLEAAKQFVLYKTATIEQTSFVQVVANFKSLAAQAYWQAGDLKTAQNIALEVLDAGMSDYHDAKIDAYHVLYQVAKAQGDNDLALSYFEQYHQADKAAIDIAKARMFAYQQAKHELVDKEFQLATMSYVQEVARLENQMVQQSMYQERFLLLILIATIVVLIGFLIRGSVSRQAYQQQTEKDSVTGLVKRRPFLDQLLECHDLARTKNLDFTLVVFDLDDFRKINQRYGYQTGDRVLRQVAELVQTQLEGARFMGRIGGDEFMIAIPDLDRIESSGDIERYRELISSMEFSALGTQFKVTASFGIADVSQLKYNFSGLIAATESALMVSKKSGKNCQTISEVKPVSETAIAYT